MNVLVSRMAAVAAEADWPLGVLFRLTLLLALAWVLHAALLRRIHVAGRAVAWLCGGGAGARGVGAACAGNFLGSAAAERRWAAGRQRYSNVRALAARAPAADPVPMTSDFVHRPTVAEPHRTGAVAISGPEPAAGGAEAPAAERPWSVVTTLWTLWIFGLVVGLSREAIAIVRVGRLRRGAQAPDARSSSRPLRSRSELGLGRPFDILITRELQTPCVVGLWWPAILLPGGSANGPSGDDLPAVLAHEIQHLKGADLPWNAMLRGLGRLLWFHPLAWAVRLAHVSACDAVCDAVAADLIGDVTAYCRTLARLCCVPARRTRRSAWRCLAHRPCGGEFKLWDGAPARWPYRDEWLPWRSSPG